MSTYDDRMFSSDLDAFRSDGSIQTRSITMSGVVAGGAQYSQTTTAFILTDIDFYQVSFDNSYHHSGKFRDVDLEYGTFIHENTSGNELGGTFEPKINGNNLTITLKIFNDSASPVTLQTTTINFQFVAYDSTLL